jgi:hypothetical protein
MPLLPSFQRINSKAAINKRSSNNLANEDSKKRQKSDKKEKHEKLVVVKNEHQHELLKTKQSETWKKTFKSAYVDSRPSWDGEKNGECYDNCNRKESHVSKDDIPPANVKEVCAFIAKRRSE